MTRAERRRQGRSDAVGIMSCKFCKSTKGTFRKSGNRFVCRTEGCKGADNAK